MTGASTDNAGNNVAPDCRPENDWVQRPATAFLFWWFPLGIGFASNLFALPLYAGSLVWAVAFVWMGAGCVLNARRCHRLHCYISGPVFLLGALAVGLLGSGASALVSPALDTIVGVTLGLVLLSFVPEIVWKRYG